MMLCSQVWQEVMSKYILKAIGSQQQLAKRLNKNVGVYESMITNPYS